MMTDPASHGIRKGKIARFGGDFQPPVALAFKVTVFIAHRPAIGFSFDAVLDLVSSRVTIGSSGSPRL
jgi:hypothetical protein